MNLTNVDTVMETAEFKLNGEWIITATRAGWHEVIYFHLFEFFYYKYPYNVLVNNSCNQYQLGLHN